MPYSKKVQRLIKARIFNYLTSLFGAHERAALNQAFTIQRQKTHFLFYSLKCKQVVNHLTGGQDFINHLGKFRSGQQNNLVFFLDFKLYQSWNLTTNLAVFIFIQMVDNISFDKNLLVKL